MWSHGLVLLGLFPSGDFKEVSVGPYVHFGATTSELPLSSVDLPAGIDLQARRLYETDNPGTTPTAEVLRFRAYRDGEGRLHIDELGLRSLLVSFHMRPQRGEKFDLGLFAGSWDEVLRHGEGDRAHWSVYSPVQFTLLGLSNNDMDEDNRTKYYIGAGTGLGADAIAKVLGPLGIHARGESRWRSVNRYRRDDINTTRHELALEGEVGLSLLGDTRAWVLNAWGEMVTQWDPRDEDGRNGVDRQYYAGGVRLSVRFHEGSQGLLSAEPDLEQLLDRLREGIEPGDLSDLEVEPSKAALGEFLNLQRLNGEDPGEGEAPEPEEDEAEASPEEGGVLLVHWSEPEILERLDPALPEGLGGDEATCSLRFFVDTDGLPYDIQPVHCAPPLLAPAMSAAWQWRLAPFDEEGRPRRIQFHYAFRFDRGGR